jgi:hypothetical protein
LRRARGVIHQAANFVEKTIGGLGHGENSGCANLDKQEPR